MIVKYTLRVNMIHTKFFSRRAFITFITVSFKYLFSYFFNIHMYHNDTYLFQNSKPYLTHRRWGLLRIDLLEEGSKEGGSKEGGVTPPRSFGH